MKNTFGNSLSVTLFGESHGEKIGAVVDGIAPGIEVDEEFINKRLSLRRPKKEISTSRVEGDRFEIVSGVINGKTTGTPLTILIENSNKRSGDYDFLDEFLRPSHADMAANAKYHGFQDRSGGGHFSGRITAPIVAAGAIVLKALEKKGIHIATHIKECAGVKDREFKDIEKDADYLNNSYFAVLDSSAAEKMTLEIQKAKSEGDSVGGILETVIWGVGAGIGEPWFDTVEGVLAKAMFSIPAVKGVEFGKGFELAKMKGSQANDPFVTNGKNIKTKTNNSGGINGGITNSMPIVLRCVVKPTPTIMKEQETVNFKKMENAVFAAKGRHDPCIVHRARAVSDSMAALAIADLCVLRYGTDWLRSDKD